MTHVGEPWAPNCDVSSDQHRAVHLVYRPCSGLLHLLTVGEELWSNTLGDADDRGQVAFQCLETLVGYSLDYGGAAGLRSAPAAARG